MITLIRWYLYKSKEVKYKCAFYTMLDKTMKEINTGEFKDKFLKEFMPYLAEVIHKETEKNHSTENNTVKQYDNCIYQKSE